MIRRLILISLAAIVVLGAALPAQAAPLRSNIFQSFKFRVACGVQVKELGGMSCFSAAIPSGELDGFVQLNAKGEAETGERGDSPWPPKSASRTLRKGQVWRRTGVTCKRKANVVRCANGDDHGFLIAPKTFTTF